MPLLNYNALCDFVNDAVTDHLSSVIHGVPCVSSTTRDQLWTTLVSDSRLRRPQCISPLKNVLTFLHLPKVFFMAVSQEISISKSIQVRTSSGINIFHLNGIIYHEGFHFTSRIIKQNGTVWFHDGQLGRGFMGPPQSRIL